MDLSVDETNVYKVLADLRVLVRDNLLPRITQLEQELCELRWVTWPVCQSLREVSQLNDLKTKQRFLSLLDYDVAMRLLHEKAIFSTKEVKTSTFQFLVEEEKRILGYSNDDE